MFCVRKHEYGIIIEFIIPNLTQNQCLHGMNSQRLFCCRKIGSKYW